MSKRKTLRFRNPDGVVRRSVPSTPDALYRRLAVLEARDGLDEVFVAGAWRSIHTPGPGLVGAILAGGAR